MLQGFANRKRPGSAGGVFAFCFSQQVREMVDFLVPGEIRVPGLRVHIPSLLRGSYPLEGRGAGTQPRSHGDSGLPAKALGSGSRQLASEFTPDDSDSPARGKG